MSKKGRFIIDYLNDILESINDIEEFTVLINIKKTTILYYIL